LRIGKAQVSVLAAELTERYAFSRWFGKANAHSEKTQKMDRRPGLSAPENKASARPRVNKSLICLEK
jgi:hypothetical protein